MLSLDCPICKDNTRNQASLFIIKKDSVEYRIQDCPTCKHIYTFFNQNINIQEYYDERDYQVKDTKHSIFYKVQAFEYRGVIVQIKKLLTKDDLDLLDFGCGKGLFLNFAKKNGFVVKGVETSLPRAEYAKYFFSLNINTQTYIDGNIFNQQFDVITIFHVLEHLPSPQILLSNLLHNNLKPEGILVLEVPNIRSWQALWSGKNWLHLDIPRHINHFSVQKLNEILSSLGFQVKKKHFFSWHLGIIGMIQTIWCWFGYQGFLIGDLKENRNINLLIKIAISLPFAFILEFLASVFNKGGVIRLYAQKQGK